MISLWSTILRKFKFWSNQNHSIQAQRVHHPLLPLDFPNFVGVVGFPILLAVLPNFAEADPSSTHRGTLKLKRNKDSSNTFSMVNEIDVLCNQKNITVCIKLALIPSEKRLSDYLYSEAKSKGYVSGQLYYRCALNNYSLGTCLEFGNKNSLLIKYHDREKCYLGDEHAFKMSISWYLLIE